MTVTTSRVRVDIHLANEAKKLLGAKSRTEATHIAVREIVKGFAKGNSLVPSSRTRSKTADRSVRSTQPSNKF